jgi:hypothetical protein
MVSAYMLGSQRLQSLLHILKLHVFRSNSELNQNREFGRQLNTPRLWSETSSELSGP